MTQYLKGYELKDKAKDKLRGKYRLAITFFLFQMLVRQHREQGLYSRQ